MRPRPALLLGALIAPALPLIAAAPAHAASTICVVPVSSGVSCTTTRNTIAEAIAVAASGDTIRLGSTTYNGDIVLPTGVSLRGGGAGTGTSATRIILPAGAQTYVTANGGTVADLRVDITTGNGATGIAATNAIVDNVVVFGPGAASSIGIQAQGSQIHDATLNLTGGSSNTALRSLGGNLLLSDSTWNGGAVGYRLVSGTDTVSRITVNSAGTAVLVEGGTLNIDDAVLDLGSTGAAGLLAQPTSTSASVTANHLTVVGGPAASRGVVADATAAAPMVTASVTLTNSVVRGPETSLVSVGGGSLPVSRSNYEDASGGGVTPAPDNLVGADPTFVNPAAGDYRLRATSPLVDQAAGSGASLDRDGKDRSFDGDGDLTPEPDMGAYELRDVTPPNTTFTSGPSGPTNHNTPVFQFRGQDARSFECRLDQGSWQPCSSPATTPPLADGGHSFQVRAFDEVFNVEPTPATRTFTVDTVAPNATITKKPPKRFFKKRVKFKFATSEPGATLQCKLDRRAWRTCHATYRFNTKVGKHVMRVRAVDAAGNVDRSPARYKYKRLKRR